MLESIQYTHAIHTPSSKNSGVDLIHGAIGAGRGTERSSVRTGLAKRELCTTNKRMAMRVDAAAQGSWEMPRLL